MAKKRLAYVMVIPSLLVILAFFFFPGIYTIYLSFFRFNLLRLQEGAKFAGLRNYFELVKDRVFLLSLYNTFVPFTIATVGLRLILGLIIALLFNAQILRRLRLMGIARALLLIPWLTPQVVAVVIWKWLCDETYGAINIALLKLGILKRPISFFSSTSTVWLGVDTIVIWRELPFVIIVLLAGLQSIPEHLYEAAEIDGASHTQQFFYITLPQLKPVIAVTLLLTTFWTFNNFVYIWLSTEGGPGHFTQVLASYIYVVSFKWYELGYASMLGTFMAGIMAIFAILYLKFVGKRILFQ